MIFPKRFYEVYLECTQKNLLFDLEKLYLETENTLQLTSHLSNPMWQD